MRLFCITILSILLSACGNSGNPKQQAADTTIKADTSVVVTGNCSDPAAMKKISEALAVENVVGLDEEELTAFEQHKKNDFGLESYELDTLYDDHCIMSVDAFAESMGAYPTSWHTYLNFDKRTGDSLLPSAFLDATHIDRLIKMCNTRLRKIIADTRKEYTDEDLETYNSYMNETDTVFNKRDVNNFFISGDSLTFVYNFGFPHVIQALEPFGHISFHPTELEPYLKKDGSLAFWIK